MLSYVSGFQNLTKTKKHYFTLSKKKKWWNYEVWWNYEIDLPQNGLSLSSEEAEKTASSSHKQAPLSLTPGAGTMKTHAQQVWNITCKTLLLTIIT